MTTTQLLPLLLSTLSILTSFVTIITFINYLKFKIDNHERRIDLLETKEIPNIHILLTQHIKENTKTATELTNITKEINNSLQLLNLEFKIRVKENSN